MNILSGYLRRFIQSLAFYPVSILYATATVVVVAVASGALRLDIALIVVALVAILSIQLSMRREVVKVHLLVNSQRDRIDQLISALVAAGVRVPPTTREVADDRDER